MGRVRSSRPEHLQLRPSGSFKRRGLAASHRQRQEGWDFGGRKGARATSAAATAAPRPKMSGRVGDLSPKQKEALAKVSPHPGSAPPQAAALSLPRRRAGKVWVGGV